MKKIEKIEEIIKEIAGDMYMRGEIETVEDRDNLSQSVIDGITIEEVEGLSDEEIREFYQDFIEESLKATL